MLDFSLGTNKARRQWPNIFKVLKEKNWQTRILYQYKYPSGMKIKTSFDERKQTEFVAGRPALKKVQKFFGQKGNGIRGKLGTPERNRRQQSG